MEGAVGIRHQTMSNYPIYKPLRNYLRKLDLLESLDVIRAYIQFLEFRDNLPEYIEVSREFLTAKDKNSCGLYRWDLADLAKEIIFNCTGQRSTKSLRKWGVLADAVNRLKNTQDAFYQNHRNEFKNDILLEIYRTTHRQFPWQHRFNQNDILRNFRIFSSPDVEQILERTLSLNTREIYKLGMALVGNFHGRLAVNINADTSGLLVRTDSFSHFLQCFSIKFDALQAKIGETQSYDQDYSYTFNPLRTFPLIQTKLNGKSVVISPVPRFVQERFTDGIYYDLVDQSGFDTAYGIAFQKYVGDVIEAANKKSCLTLLPEMKYHKKRGNEQFSVDWIVSDSSAHLFVECKAKRLRRDSKIKFVSTDSLDDDFKKLSTAVVQVYKTLNDAIQGHYPDWTHRSLPIFPLVVTPSAWYIFGDRVHKMLHENVRADVVGAGLTLDILEKYPYTICEIDTFELLIQVIAQRNIQDILSNRVAGQHSMWLLKSYLSEYFSKELDNQSECLFPEDWAKIHTRINR